MDWRKAPPIIREVRIAYLIPEIRWSTCGTIGWRLLSWFAIPVTAIQALVPALIYTLGTVLKGAGERLLGLPNLWAYCRRKLNESIDEGHQVMPPNEIQARVYPPAPTTGDTQ